MNTQRDKKAQRIDEKPVRVGVFATITAADEAVDNLLSAGFSKDQISVITSDKAKRRYFDEQLRDKPAGERAPGAAVTGGSIGAALGGLAALAGFTTAAGTGVLVAGVLLTAAGGAVAGGLVGLMMARGVEQEMADYYDQAVTDGKILVAVEDKGKGNAGRLEKAEEAFEKAGAEPVPLRQG